jgi:parvulin-like peptidyl-prolyl isomerase
MRVNSCRCWAAILIGFVCGPLGAQETKQNPANPLPAPNVVAATVNGQPISELAVQRGLNRLPPAKQADARQQIVDFLIDNLLLDQYLTQLGVQVTAKEVEARLVQLQDEAKKAGETVEKMMQELKVSEEELRTQLASELRWDRYCDQKATDAVLRNLFDKNPEMFDGSMVRARHILLSPPSGDARAAEEARTRLQGIKRQVEELAVRALAQIPPGADALSREKARTKEIEDAFAALAGKESTCPSKAQGGDLGWFPRSGSMVEPFAKAAFELKNYQMTDVVATQFGYHLILVTDRRPGKETKFDDIKDIVKEVFCERLREAYCAQLKPRARIVINPVPKP